MRAIAAEAGVDAALISHFFGSKANLLAPSLDWPFDPDQELPGLLSAGKDQVGERLVALLVRTWDREGSPNPVIALLRAASSEPTVADLLAEVTRPRLAGLLLAELGADQPELRANLVASQLGGARAHPLRTRLQATRLRPAAGRHPLDSPDHPAVPHERPLGEALSLARARNLF